MTDYRDPNYRDPVRPGFPGPGMPSDPNWSTATWGWIAGIAIVVLVLIFAFGVGDERDRVATDSSRSPTTSGQRALPPAPPVSQAPSMNPVPPEPPPAKPQQ